MWSSRARSRDEEERYRERTTDRLRGVGAANHLSTEDPEEIRARLERLNYGASRRPRSSESPA